MTTLKTSIKKTNKKVFGAINPEFIAKKIKEEIRKNKNKTLFLEKLDNLEKSIGPKYPIVDAHVHVVDFL
jgi:hypothetical protein